MRSMYLAAAAAALMLTACNQNRSPIEPEPVGGEKKAEAESVVTPAKPARESQATANTSPNSLETLSFAPVAQVTGIANMDGSSAGTMTDFYSMQPTSRAKMVAPTYLGVTTMPVGEPFNTERYDRIDENGFQSAQAAPLSTFSIDVDTASYSNVRRFVDSGTLPARDAVRIEEMINYFTYDYAEPTNGDPFSVNVDVAECPWQLEHRLIRIGIKGKDIDISQRPDSNLVFLIDVSGSMNSPNKLPLLKQSLESMIMELDSKDSVSMVVYAGAAGVVCPPTPGSNRARIFQSLDNLQAGGSTNGGQGIELAYKLAQDNFIEDGINRVILCTDGDFNVGTSDTGSLTRLVEERAKDGVFLTVLGFGTGNLNDEMMEEISNRGNGNYAYIDNAREGRKVLVENMSGTLITIAKDVKIQVEFNPAEVQAYRLVGYENRMMANEDFNDDTKDAGEIGAGHTVTAFYEVVPHGVDIDLADIDELKYQEPAKTTYNSGELCTVKLRYKAPDADTSDLIEVAVADQGKRLLETDDDFIFAASVAAYGMLLRDPENPDLLLSLDTISEMADAASATRTTSDEHRQEFVSIVQKTRDMFVQREVQ